MKIYCTKSFSRFTRREKINDEKLIEAILNANQGLVDSDLGGYVIKQRIPRDGHGKSGGYRSIIAFRKSELSFFIYGFAKSDTDNITKEELNGLKELAKDLLKLNNEQIEKLVQEEVFREVTS